MYLGGRNIWELSVLPVHSFYKASLQKKKKGPIENSEKEREHGTIKGKNKESMCR